MTPYNQLMQRIQNGEQILIDGATGTEVERRGVPQLDNAWNGGGAITHPDIVRQIHEEYITHGAEIIISNTFATGRHNLLDASCVEQFDSLNRRGVELAIEARANQQTPNVLVAGGISHWDFNNNPPSLADLRQNVLDQAAIMAEAGADLLMLEMMVDMDKLRVVVESAKQVGLPIWAGLSCDLAEDGTPKLQHKGSLLEAMAYLKSDSIDLLNIMHTQVEYVDTCLDVVQDNWSKPVGVYAHSGIFIDGKWIFESVISPDDYAAAAEGWLKRGVNVIGGCCGVGVRHIETLNGMMKS